MRRIILVGGVSAAVVVVVVAAQPPAAPPLVPPAPPAPLGPTPGAPIVPPPAPGDSFPPVPPRPLPTVGAPTAPPAPVVSSETLLSQFEPLASFPAVTQFAVGGVLRGSTWMGKMHQAHGRFIPGYNPALRQPLAGDHDIKQAQCALGLAQVAKFSGDKEQAALARQTILALLASAPAPQSDPTCRVPVQASFVCNRVGFAALVALAIYELPNPDDKLIEDAERLCEFLRRALRPDGSVHYTDGPADVPTQIDPNGVNEYPGCALHALAVSNRTRPAEWKKEAVKKGVAYYAGMFRTKPHPMLAATVTPAATELYLQTKLTEVASAALEMNDWLCTLQIPPTDPRTPQWAGGFRSVVNGQATDAPPTTAETGLYVQSLACAYVLARSTVDVGAREAKYRPALLAAVEFLCGLQYAEVNTRHFENTFRANMLIGAFHQSGTDGNLRTDATACALVGLLRFLSCGAERNGR